MEALQAGKQNFAVFVLNVPRPRMAAQKKFVSTLSGKKLRHFLPGDAEPTTFEESTGRKLTVVNQSKNCQQRKTRGGEKIPGMREIPFGGTQIFFLLPDIADMPAPDL